MFFSLNKTAQKPGEVLVVDLHTPTKFQDAVLSETLPSADVIDAVKESLTIPPAISYWLCWMTINHSSKASAASADGTVSDNTASPNLVGV